MKTLLAFLLILALTMVGVLAQDNPPAPCDPETDPTCAEQCPRGANCCYILENPECTPPPPKATRAPIVTATPGYQPGTVSIWIPAPADGWYKVEWFDSGAWWLVVDKAHPDGIVLRSVAGYVELIGRAGQDPDPTHYRLISEPAQ